MMIFNSILFNYILINLNEIYFKRMSIENHDVKFFSDNKINEIISVLNVN